jgi:hypothetical protein
MKPQLASLRLRGDFYFRRLVGRLYEWLAVAAVVGNLGKKEKELEEGGPNGKQDTLYAGGVKESLAF